MSLISRVEVTNYLTEGIDAHRRSVDWQPMLSGITLRMDGESTLVNITNGGGKTSLAELLLYLLSRDDRLHKRIRDKAAPRNRGYTHARIEFRDTSEDSFTERRLLETDPLNIPGQTHVVGVVLNDDERDVPVFYSYSGVLEDSPCYRFDSGRISQVPNSEFVARTKALRGCRWNKFTSRQAWEDHIRLFLPVEVIRRNAIYQLKGSDDKNASFFDFAPKSGESYDSAFFRAVVAPDLLSNLLSTFSEEDETLVEDTLFKSLSRIVDADREIARKERRLASREVGIGQLAPILDAARGAQALQQERDGLLRELRKDIAVLRHFGLPNAARPVPGIPRAIPTLGEQDPRIGVALKGMVITRDDGILLLDRALADIAGVEVSKLNQVAVRKNIDGIQARSQVIDLTCDFGFLTSAGGGGGHYRKGYTQASCAALVSLIATQSAARTEGVDKVLSVAFGVAEAQLDSNPASHQVRRLEREVAALEVQLKTGSEEAHKLQIEINRLNLQLKDRQENQGAWDDFVAIGEWLPEGLRLQPEAAKAWIDKQLAGVQDEIAKRNRRHGTLGAAWAIYLAVLDEEGLQGIDGVRVRHQALTSQRAGIVERLERSSKGLEAAEQTLRREQTGLTRHAVAAADAVARLERFQPHESGHRLFVQVFGEVDPTTTDPSVELQDALQAVNKARQDAQDVNREIEELTSLRRRAAAFVSIFGDGADALTCNPVAEHTRWTEQESTARQSMAQLTEKVEALEAFEALHPGTAPETWMKNAEQERARLTKARQEEEERRAELHDELTAIDEMRSVDDGAFQQAWAILLAQGVRAERLHHVVQHAGYPASLCSDVLSALSALLPAPVFDSADEMERAASLLDTHSVCVPMVLKHSLLQAAQSGLGAHGGLRTVAFLGGKLSRRVRILLDADFAAAERLRLSAALERCNDKLVLIGKALPRVEPGGEPWRLAERANDAVTQGVREKYRRFELEATAAALELLRIKAQITPESLEVLRCAAEFKRLRGDVLLAELDDRQLKLKDELEQSRRAEEAARKRASPANVEAHRAALQYHRLGGKTAHQHASATRERTAADLELAEARAAESAEEVERLRVERRQAEEAQEEFHRARAHEEIERLQQAIAFDDRPDDVQFMQHFEAESRPLQDKQQELTDACRVNFVRAQSFLASQGKSEQELAATLASAQQRAGQLATQAGEIRTRLDTIRDAEVPTWKRLARAIHEMAYEIGSRVARTDVVSRQAGDLEEGQAVAEVHLAYHDIESMVQLLERKGLEAQGAVVEQVERVSQLIQSMDLQEALGRHRLVDAQCRQAVRSYTELNERFCVSAEAALGSPDAAFNALEIDEIRRATPSSLQRLAGLFDQLQRSLDTERDEALRAKRVAEETNEDTIRQLSYLIVAAEHNLELLNKVMKRYPKGRFFFEADISKDEKVRDILGELKLEVERAHLDDEARGRSMRRSDDRQLKKILRDRLIDCVFTNTKVEFINAGIWGGKCSVLDARPSTGQKIALEFMWIVRQAEYEIERGLLELSGKQAAKARARTNRVIFIDGIFSTLSNRKIIREALNGLRDLGGNFQVIGFLHSPTWVNDPSVFPVYHVGKKLGNTEGDSLVTFREAGRAPGTLGFISLIAQPIEVAAQVP